MKYFFLFENIFRKSKYVPLLSMRFRHPIIIHCLCHDQKFAKNYGARINKLSESSLDYHIGAIFVSL